MNPRWQPKWCLRGKRAPNTEGIKLSGAGTNQKTNQRSPTVRSNCQKRSLRLRNKVGSRTHREGNTRKEEGGHTKLEARLLRVMLPSQESTNFAKLFRRHEPGNNQQPTAAPRSLQPAVCTQQLAHEPGGQ
jgi:hypothetical protein